MEKTKGNIEKALNLLNIQREKEGDYSERRTREDRCGINFGERRFGYSTDRFQKKFDDLCLGEHRFAICEDSLC